MKAIIGSSGTHHVILIPETENESRQLMEFESRIISFPSPPSSGQAAVLLISQHGKFVERGK